MKVVPFIIALLVGLVTYVSTEDHLNETHKEENHILVNEEAEKEKEKEEDANAEDFMSDVEGERRVFIERDADTEHDMDESKKVYKEKHFDRNDFETSVPQDKLNLRELEIETKRYLEEKYKPDIEIGSGDPRQKKPKKKNFDAGNNKALKRRPKREKAKRKVKPASFPLENSNVKELFKNNTDIISGSTHGRFLIFLYRKLNNRTFTMNKIFNQASLLKKKELSDVSFYRVNAKLLSKFAMSLGAIEFPTIMLVAKDQEAIYEFLGELSLNNVVKFVAKMLKINILEAKSEEHFKKIAHQGSNILLIGDIKRHKKSFFTIAKYSKKFFRTAFWSKSQDFFNKFGIDRLSMDAAAYFTVNGTLNAGERMNFTPDEINKEKILHISEVYSRSVYSWLTHHKFETILYTGLKAVIVIYRDTSNIASIEAAMKKLALKYRENFYFLKTSLDKPIGDVIVEIFHLDEDNELPRVVLIDTKKSNGIDNDVYKMEKGVKLSEENIDNFIQSFDQGKLQRILISEPLRSDYHTDSIIHKLVENIESIHHSNSTSNSTAAKVKERIYIPDIIGFTFDRRVFNQPGLDIVIYVCTDSDFCRGAEFRVKRAYKMLIENPKLRIFKVNYLMNEAPGLNITHVPSIFMLPDIAVNKEKTVIKFDKEITTHNLVSFISQNAVNKIKDIQALPREDRVKEVENKKKVKIRTREKDESELEREYGFPLGNGFTRTVRRWIYKYEERGKKDDENVDHDNEDYDEDVEENKEIKEDL